MSCAFEDPLSEVIDRWCTEHDQQTIDAVRVCQASTTNVKSHSDDTLAIPSDSKDRIWLAFGDDLKEIFHVLPLRVRRAMQFSACREGFSIVILIFSFRQRDEQKQSSLGF